jgi:hypothetical protein
MGKSRASALGWTCSPKCRYLSGGNITLQGILIRQTIVSIPVIENGGRND